MDIRIRDDGSIISEQAFLSMHPNTSFPATLTPAVLASFGADPVLESPLPNAAPGQRIAQDGAIQDERGNWLRKWKVEAIPSGQAAAAKKAAKERQWVAIQAERTRRELGGIKVGAHWFHTDSDSRAKIRDAVLMGQALTPNLQWTVMGGGSVTMTPALAQQVFAATTARDHALHTRSKQHKAGMEAAPDPAAYSFVAGWPAIYEPA
jgi:hypothetical protein